MSKGRRTKWAVYVGRMEDRRNGWGMMVKPETPRVLQTNRRRLKDNITMDLKVTG
jgi:hypothetical protein